VKWISCVGDKIKSSKIIVINFRENIL